MAIEDKIKWNKKYKDIPKLLKQRDPSPKLVEMIKECKGKKALEIACGSGRNSIYLAQNGFEVEALDISEVALKSLDEKNYKNITTKLVDLEGYIPKENNYDLIVKTNYLDRKIIPHLAKALKKDGLLLIETYMEDKENEKPPSNPDYLLKKDELKNFFDNSFKILEYDEFFNESYEIYKMKKQAICVKKI
ncbi:MAG: class I SAM-dependent methyltransferase [Halarcobacter sp.]